MASIDLRGVSMKIHGKKIQGPNEIIVPIPRSNSDDIIFKVQGIIDLEAFVKLCPQPVPPKIMLKGGITKEDIEDKGFKIAIHQWAQKKTAWMTLESLRATPGLEWETVKYDDPNTYANYEKELKDSGLSDNEISRIIIAVAEVNGLSEERIEEARQRFLAGEAERQKQQDSQMEEQKNTPFGEPANGSVSDHQDSKVPQVGTS